MPVPAQSMVNRVNLRSSPLMEQRPRPRYSNLPKGPFMSTSQPRWSLSRSCDIPPEELVDEYILTRRSRNPVWDGGEIGVYGRIIASFLRVSRRRSKRCWPMGRPRVWPMWSSLNVNLRVSGEMVFLEWRIAFPHDRDLRKLAFGFEPAMRSGVSPSARIKIFEAESRVPM